MGFADMEPQASVAKAAGEDSLGSGFTLTAVEAGSHDEDLSEAEAAQLLRKTDMRLLPMLFIIYLAAFLDRWVFLGPSHSCADRPMP